MLRFYFQLIFGLFGLFFLRSDVFDLRFFYPRPHILWWPHPTILFSVVFVYFSCSCIPSLTLLLPFFSDFLFWFVSIKLFLLSIHASISKLRTTSFFSWPNDCSWGYYLCRSSALFFFHEGDNYLCRNFPVGIFVR